jgi:hypothetical protein
MLSAGSLLSQQGDLFIPREIQQAYENGTRSYSGKPGENYFQNHADYDIDAEFHPKTGRLEGSEQITYHNNSPDTLKYIALRLYMNFYRKGIDRDYEIPQEDIHEGIKIKHFAYNGTRLDSIDGPKADKERGTIQMIPLPEPIKPEDEATLSIDWEVELPEKSTIRFGETRENNWFVAYWYPRISVYNDITGVYIDGDKTYRSGWDATPWTGAEEFYNDFSDYDVSLSVPEDYVVWATGILQEPGQHFKPKILKRFRMAHESDTVVPIITSEDIQKKEILRSNRPWHFQAEQVPDFAFATSKKYLWDGTSVRASASDTRRIFVSSAYPINHNLFNRAAMISRDIIDLFPEQIIPARFPFPKLTAVSAGEDFGGGMEYPMMNNCTDYEDTLRMKIILAAELIHNYFPFHVMTNESDYAFLDEGLTSLLSDQTLTQITKKLNLADEQEHFSSTYEAMAGSRRDIPPMTQSYMVSDYPAYFHYAYDRPGAAYYLLKQMVGEKSFIRALGAFMERWEGKHPTPYDFFFTFEDVLNRDLSWFWEPWFFDFGYPDLAIEDVKNTDSGHHITIKQKGKLPVPVDLTVWLDNGSTKEINKSPAVWKNRDHYEVTLDSDQPIDSIKLEHQTVPDVYPENNAYRAQR